MTLAIAASLAEICSMFPTAGSIYFWSSQCAGPKYGAFFAWLTAILNCAAWVMNCAGDALAGAK